MVPSLTKNPEERGWRWNLPCVSLGIVSGGSPILLRLAFKTYVFCPLGHGIIQWIWFRVYVEPWTMLSGHHLVEIPQLHPQKSLLSSISLAALVAAESSVSTATPTLLESGPSPCYGKFCAHGSHIVTPWDMVLAETWEQDRKSYPGIDIETNQDEMLCLPWRKGTDVITVPPSGW